MEPRNDQHTSWTERVRSHRLLTSFALLGTLSAGVLAGSVLTGTVHGAMQQTDSRDAAPLRVPPAVVQPNEFATIAKEVGPAVVKINIEQLPKDKAATPTPRRGRRAPGQGSGDQGDMQDFFNRFFGGQGGQGGQGGGDDDDSGPAGGEKRALGSGFIVDPRGYIITNNHVVDKADRIYVKLSTDADTDIGHVGHVIGTDKDTDIAVVKIDSPTPLPTVKMGNSDAEQLGDWVLAIGSPFDLSQTVTAGIVSAKNRSIPDNSGVASQFQRFIQTDAAINPGNSGGPLLNMRGEAIGVNTAIYTSGMGSQGVGFAVPSNTVIDVYNMLISPEHKVVRGSIGIQFQGNQSSAVGRVYGFAKGGVLIAQVTPGKPAAKAGLQAKDVITSIDGKAVKDGDELVANISARRPGSTVRIGYLRGTQEQTATVGIADRADVVGALNGQGDEDNAQDQPEAKALNYGKLGITIQAVPANVLQQKKLQGGVLITSVKPGAFVEDLSPFPLSKGDIIVEVNRKPVTDPDSFRNIINGLRPGDDVVFVVRPGQARDGVNSFVGGVLP